MLAPSLDEFVFEAASLGIPRRWYERRGAERDSYSGFEQGDVLAGSGTGLPRTGASTNT